MQPGFPVGHPVQFLPAARRLLLLAVSRVGGPGGSRGWREGSWEMEGKVLIWEKTPLDVSGETLLLPSRSRVGTERGTTDDPGPRPGSPEECREDGVGSPREELSWHDGSPGGVHSCNPRGSKAPTPRARITALPPRPELASGERSWAAPDPSPQPSEESLQSVERFPLLPARKGFFPPGRELIPTVGNSTVTVTITMHKSQASLPALSHHFRRN